MRSNRRAVLAAMLGALCIGAAGAQTVLDSPELYAGEKSLYEAAKKEGMVVSFDTGPTWANWAAQFSAFKRRYPDVEIVYNDLGSAATVVALDKARNRPQADTAYYFAASAVDAAKRGLVAPFRAGELRQTPWCVQGPRREVVHDPLADRRVHRQHEAREERAADVGPTCSSPSTRTRWSTSTRARPASVRCSPSLPTSPRADRHGRRQAGARLSRQAAPVGQRAARARHDALRAIRQGRDPDLDLVRERRAQGQAHRRAGRRGRGGDPAARRRPRRPTASAWSRRGRIRTPESCG